MAEELSSCDKVNHPNVHTHDREAQDAHRAGLKCLDNALIPADLIDERRINRDEAEDCQTQPHHGQSTSSSSSSTISSSTESTSAASTATTSVLRTPPSPTSMTVGDTPRPGVRFTDRGPPRTSSSHLASYRRASSSAGMGMEWGVLFDEDGYATMRNDQFLRSLANYIIEELAPDSSNLVITPEKLSALYSRYRLNPEIYPFLEILNSRARDVHDRLADFFTDLDCQYHLVQLDSYSRPRVPALTPIGFVQYFTTCILAHPDEEFRRLDKIVADVQLVINPSIDGEPERLPRQLFRSQFPVRCDPKSKKILTAALDDLIYDLRLLEPSSPRSPLAIMPPPPSPSTKERNIVPVIRRYIIPRGYTKREEYEFPSSSATGQPRRRHLRNTNEEKSNRVPMDDQDREHYHDRMRSHCNKELSSYRIAPPGGGSHNTVYSPATTYPRTRSPPPRAYRASAPDVSAPTGYFRPAGYLPPPPLTIAERREYAMSLTKSGAAAENSSPRGDVTDPREDIKRRESSSGRTEANSSKIVPLVQGSSNEAVTSKTPVSSPTAATNVSPTPPATATTQQRSRRGSTSSKKEAESPTGTSSIGEKKHRHSYSHSYNHSHHRHRGAVEDDKGPTWEEVLKSPSSSHHHHHHHHHHHRSGGKSHHPRHHSFSH
ncbi:hypothetical protein F5Y11DRAFT_349453 [Daldinia sp. FL1419]|nr:hypothetical protein F5Y11DRAFT_349453 [Daldinia sp. FL1419]